jgi:hypothetical protein
MPDNKLPGNKLLVYTIDQFGNPVDATVSLDTGTKFTQEAAGRYAASSVPPGRRIVQADAPGSGRVQIPIDVPERGLIEQRLVLPHYKIVITPSPTIASGSVLKASTSPPLDEQYSWEWDVIGPKVKSPEVAQMYNRTCNECIVDANLDPGDYAIQLTIQYGDPPGCTATLREPFTIYAPNVRTKAQEQQELYNRAKEVALLFTDNFDKKLDTLNKGVSTISQRMIGGPGAAVNVQLLRNNIEPSATRPIWMAIRNRSEAMTVSRLEEFLNRIFCVRGLSTPGEVDRAFPNVLGAFPSFHDVHSYELLRTAVEAFLIEQCGVAIRPPRTDDVTGRAADRAGSDLVPGAPPQLTVSDAQTRLAALLGSRGRLPYIEKVVRQIFQSGVPQGEYVNPLCYGILAFRDQPCLIELIWSYWHEEGMLVQSMAALTRRFQNVRGTGERDPLANLTLEPLRPLSNLLFGYLQDERDRLSLVRRAYEYDNEYGIRLVGRAVPVLRPAESRSKFLEAFHNLLYVATEFYLQADDTTVVADGFKVLNALREVHLLLSQGAHNQYNDLVWRARAEMLLEQWLLGREELRQFLPSRPMVVYPERWMAQVDTMKSLQGWTDTSIIHFGNLARFGEQLLLSIRFDDWNDPARTAPDAADWAIWFRPQIQGYAHDYRVVTGVDLTAPMSGDAGAVAERYAQPSVHLRRRTAAQR